jgi:hypothetical protein
MEVTPAASIFKGMPHKIHKATRIKDKNSAAAVPPTPPSRNSNLKEIFGRQAVFVAE